MLPHSPPPPPPHPHPSQPPQSSFYRNWRSICMEKPMSLSRLVTITDLAIAGDKGRFRPLSLPVLGRCRSEANLNFPPRLIRIPLELFYSLLRQRVDIAPFLSYPPIIICGYVCTYMQKYKHSSSAGTIIYAQTLFVQSKHLRI